MNNEVRVAVKDYTLTPGPRFIKSGDGSAEAFFKTHIKPAMGRTKNTILTIDFSGTWGYGPSFTSQLGIYLVEFLKDAVFDRLKTISTDDPEVEKRFWNQLKESFDEFQKKHK